MAKNQLKFRIELGLPYGIKAVRSARKAIRAVVGEWRFSDQATREIELSLSEALQNAVDHGTGKSGTIQVYCVVNDRGVKIQIEDPGAGGGNLEELKSAFGSSKEKPPQLSRDRGRGIYLIRNLMDVSKMECMAKGGVRITMIKKRI